MGDHIAAVLYHARRHKHIHAAGVYMTGVTGPLHAYFFDDIDDALNPSLTQLFPANDAEDVSV